MRKEAGCGVVRQVVALFSCRSLHGCALEWPFSLVDYIFKPFFFLRLHSQLDKTPSRLDMLTPIS